MDSHPGNAETRLKQLKFMRRGKKASITKRIAQLETFIANGEKKRMIEILQKCLQNVYGELVLVCEEITSLCPESVNDDFNNLEEYRNEVEVCLARITDHLENRAEEDTSSGSIVRGRV